MTDLTQLASHIRMVPTGLGAEDVVAFSDMEVTFFISKRHGLFVVEKTDRGGPRRTQGSFRSLDDAERLLAWLLGSSWRSSRGLRRLHWEELSTLATLDVGPTAILLEWSGGTAEFPRGFSGESVAVDYSHLVEWDVATLVAAIENASGEPILEADPNAIPVAVSRPRPLVPHAKSCRVSASVLSREAPLTRLRRVEPLNSADSGWRITTDRDDEALSLNATNSIVRNFNAIAEIEPAIADVYALPVGSDLRVSRVGDHVTIVDGHGLPVERRNSTA